MAEAKKRSKKETEDLLIRIRSRLAKGLAAESQMRDAAEDDDDFYAGNQYPAGIQKQREADLRPCLVVNKLPQFVKQVTNQIRQNRPQIRALPCDDAADVETAKIITGLLRHIQVNSRADLAYDTATEQTVVGGYGYWRILSEYVEGEVDLQEVVIKRIQNRFSVVMDPARQEPDGSDAKWAHIFSTVDKDTFEQMYPDADPTSFSDTAPNAEGWYTDDGIRLCEYMEIRYEPKKIQLLSDGRKVWEGEKIEKGLKVTASRTVQKPCVYVYKTNGFEILEETTWPGTMIPIVIMIGDEMIVDGQVIYKGLVRNAKDPQRMVNYWWTSYTELVAMAPKAPFIGYKGQFTDPDKWADSNTQPIPFLEAEPMIDAATGALLPLPQRQQFAGVPTGIEQGLRLANEDMKETTGIYDPSLGAKSNATTGVALNAQTRQGDTANFHYADNLSRSLRHSGRIILEVIPFFYDTARILRIIGEDGQVEKMQPVNGAQDPEDQSQAAKVQPVFDLTVGRYDVVVDTGPSFMTRRQEAATGMAEFIRVFPEAAPLIGDLYAKGQDWPLANEIGERLKAMLPPGAIKEEGKQEIPPEVQAQLQQSQQMIQEMRGAIQELTQKAEGKDAEIQAKLDIAEMDNATKIHIAKINAGIPEDLATLAQELIAIRSMVEGHAQILQQPIAPSPEQAGQGEPAPEPEPIPGQNP